MGMLLFFYHLPQLVSHKYKTAYDLNCGSFDGAHYSSHL